ncbi:lamin tail domain-containing protein [Streptomyces fuscichromogenes]|uniref:lamin tail domain-containing protein n=1 Tax=Streptomyces fuscichromogenes TaxID=1324013 RepID=UPI0027E4E6BD|nr:lamin tail domain-containing protein [Streptomyces fuscichromogenes]
MSVSVSVTARRLGSAAAVAAALVGAAALPAVAAAAHPSPSHRDGVVISAVRHDVQGRGIFSGRALNREWVDVTNNARRDVNLSGWTLSDADGHSYTFRHYRLEGGATVRVHTGEGRDTATDLYQDRRSSVWNHDADTATLRNDRGRYVDSASWGLNHHRDMDDRHAVGHRDGGDRNVPGHRDGDQRNVPGHRDGDQRNVPGHRDGDQRNAPGHRDGGDRNTSGHRDGDERNTSGHRR